MRSIAWKWGTFGGVIASLVGSLLWFYPETENSIDRTSPASLDDTASADRRPATTEDQSSRLSGPPGTTPSRATTPDAFLVYGVSFDPLDPVSEYLTLESESLHKSGAAMEAFGILDACRQIPGSQSVTAEIENTLALSEARQTCKEITAAASLARHELIELLTRNCAWLACMRVSFPRSRTSHWLTCILMSCSVQETCLPFNKLRRQA